MHDEAAAGPGALRLAHHLRACRLGDQVVLLDLDRSRYRSLGGAPARIVAEVIDRPAGHLQGTPGPPPVDEGHQDPTASLLRAGILTLAPGPDRMPLPRPALPVASFDDADGIPPGGIRHRDLYRFTSAVATATLWLRFRSLHAITRSIDVRLRRCERPGPDHARRMRRAVGVFDRLRPLLLTSRDRCLPDSIALVVFLADQGLPARWIVGVRSNPFRAHSWVQHDGEVLNDLHEHVRAFTPILVV